MSNLTINPSELALIDERLLPPKMRLLVRSVGMSDTVKLLQSRGGTFFRFPFKASDTLLADIVGLQVAMKLCNDYGGETWELPKADKILIKLRDIAVRKARETKSASEVALMFDLTRRHVINISPKPDDSNLDLFD